MGPLGNVKFIKILFSDGKDREYKTVAGDSRLGGAVTVRTILSPAWLEKDIHTKGSRSFFIVPFCGFCCRFVITAA